jgi:hypothetical protein
MLLTIYTLYYFHVLIFYWLSLWLQCWIFFSLILDNCFIYFVKDKKRNLLNIPESERNFYQIVQLVTLEIHVSAGETYIFSHSLLSKAMFMQVAYSYYVHKPFGDGVGESYICYCAAFKHALLLLGCCAVLCQHWLAALACFAFISQLCRWFMMVLYVRVEVSNKIVWEVVKLWYWSVFFLI